MRQDAAIRRRGWVVLGLLAVILIPISLVAAAQPLIGRQTVVAEIRFVDAPRTCRDGGLRPILGRHRSAPPHQTGWLWCGLVMTDHGAFVLPESGLFTAGDGRREAMVDALRAGCTYRLTVAGFGRALAPGQILVTQGHKTLVRLEPLGPCG